MSSNFAFLQDLWPDFAKKMELAESYVYTDPSSCITKIGFFAEQVVHELFFIEGLKETEIEDKQVTRIDYLSRQRILNGRLSSWFHQIRKTRNDSIHEGISSVEEALLCLRFAFSIAVWFMKVYGDSDFVPPEYVEPQKAEEQEPEPQKAERQIDYKPLILNQERKIKEQDELIAKLKKERELQKTFTPTQQKTKNDRIKLSNTVANNIKLTEAQTRALIDAELRAVGWEADTLNLRYSKGTRPEKGRNIAIAEWPTLPPKGRKDTGHVDYALFCGLQMIGMIEAKAFAKNIFDVIDNQGHDYPQKVRSEDAQYSINTWDNYKVPFVFATNGRPYLEQIKTESGIWFHDLRKSSNLPTAMRGWYSPDDLQQMLKHDADNGEQKLENMPYDFLRDSDGLNLRYYQIEAIEAIEKALIQNKKQMLLAMATGTGKTRTILGMIYRFLKSNRFRRILFLVDRNALGEQAQDVFKDVKLEDLKTLNKIYNIKKLGEYDLEKETRVQVATVQGMVARLMSMDQDKIIPSVGNFDCIIIDEAHRGYTLDSELSDNELFYRNQDDFISKYKYVIEYFDAVRIGLTATPAVHTTAIFGSPIYTYSFRKAVIDGYLVDFDAPHIIKTKLNIEGIHLKATDKLAKYNPITHELKNPEELKDEQDFDVEDFNRRVITKEFTQTAMEQVAKYIEPTSNEKTIIFAVTDNHADNIVEILRKIYESQELNANAIQKITSKIGDQAKIQSKIKEFKNEHYPTIAVTVDLLSTGIDVARVTKIVFMRRVKSRILYDQMLGRGTRLCPEIKKTHFEIFDCVNLYAYLCDVSNMNPISTKKTATFEDLLDSYEKIENVKNKEEIKNEITEKIIVKLHRAKVSFSKKQEELFKNETGLSLKDFIQKSLSLMKKDDIEGCKNLFLNNKNAFSIFSQYKENEGYWLVVSDKHDEYIATERGYGKNQKPEDYLESFKKFVTENRNKIAALEICCTKPADLTNESLKKLKLELDKNGFNEVNLNSAINQVKKEDIVADIISIVRSFALGSALLSHEERINNAIKKLKQQHDFTATEKKWIDRIRDYLINESVINVQTFDTNPNFKKDGGFKKFNAYFNNNLESIIREINTYLYEDKTA